VNHQALPPPPEDRRLEERIEEQEISQKGGNVEKETPSAIVFACRTTIIGMRRREQETPTFRALFSCGVSVIWS